VSWSAGGCQMWTYTYIQMVHSTMHGQGQLTSTHASCSCWMIKLLYACLMDRPDRHLNPFGSCFNARQHHRSWIFFSSPRRPILVITCTLHKKKKRKYDWSPWEMGLNSEEVKISKLYTCLNLLLLLLQGRIRNQLVWMLISSKIRKTRESS
jgi:hypothetical protein